MGIKRFIFICAVSFLIFNSNFIESSAKIYHPHVGLESYHDQNYRRDFESRFDIQTNFNKNNLKKNNHKINLVRNGNVDSYPCPCSNVSLCDVIKTPPRQELVGFLANLNEVSYLEQYVNWTQLTTLVVRLTPEFDPQIICLAHSYGVRVAHLSLFPGWEFETQNSWLTENVGLIQQFHVDGFNLDFEEKISGQNETNIISLFVERIKDTLNLINPNYQLSYCIELFPLQLDYNILNTLIDFYVVMAYDQGWGQDPLASNSPIENVISGIYTLTTEQKIPANQLVLALPWYGYSGSCNTPTSLLNATCICPNCWASVPTSYTYSQIVNIQKTDVSEPEWDKTSMTPFLNFERSGYIYQIQYDDPISLFYKAQYAKLFKLRGTGVWAIDFLNGLPVGPATQSMWDAVFSGL